MKNHPYLHYPPIPLHYPRQLVNVHAPLQRDAILNRFIFHRIPIPVCK